MSKSLDNYIGVNEPPDQIFGKLMSISDDLMWRYYTLLSSKPLKEVEALRADVALQKVHPKDVKVAFAMEITDRFCGAGTGKAAAEAFEQRFAKKQVDVSALPLHELPLEGGAGMPVPRLCTELGLTQSPTEARKLMGQGGVRVNGEKVSDPKHALGPGEYLVQVGKLKAARAKLT